jgi:hypothetical protein
MIDISIYLKNNGQIVRVVTCLDDEVTLQYNHATEKYVIGIYPGNEFYVENNLPINIPLAPNSYSVFNYDTKQWIDPRTNETQWVLVKSQRNKLLADSDWTQLPDVTLSNKTEWATYRQELRDITKQTDPFNIIWPTPPQG